MIPQLKKTIEAHDLKELELTCGLEIHQQLEGRKLFCNCPTTIRDDKPDAFIKRSLRASAGESGKIDAAALSEIKKKKTFLYQTYHDTTCLIELDEEPPTIPCPKAVHSSLQLAKLVNAQIVDQIRFMRKTVVDGSNTSGFQRTALVALQGNITTSDNQHIGIETVCLEEDSAKKIETLKHQEVYNLSRLGIPLIEIATAPHIHHPKTAKLVAEQLGLYLRSLDNVKRGLGTIRQDVNVSIKKGLRVEIKGAQDLKTIPLLVENEMLRQHNLLLLFEYLEKNNASVGKEIIDITKTLANSQSKVITQALSKPNGAILALPLYKFKDVTSAQIQPGRRYGSELSDYAKVMGVKGLFHADELPNYGITQEEKDSIFKQLNLDPSRDNFLLIADEHDIALRALKNAQERASDFSLRKEVRMARPDATSQFMRPMPGASRMYPETDIQPLPVDSDKIIPPVLLTDKMKKLEEAFNIPSDIAKKLLRDDIDLFVLANEYNKIKPKFIIDLYYATPGLIKKKYNIEIDIKLFAPVILEALQAQKITKDALEEILLKLHKGEKINFQDYQPLSLEDIKEDIDKIINEMGNAPMGAIIGKILGKYKGKINPQEVSLYLSSKK